MNNIVVEEAHKDFNPSIVSIDEDLIAKTPIDKSKIYFYFDKKENIDIRDINKNIAYILGLNSITYQFWELNANNKLERYQHHGKIAGEALLAGYREFYNKINLNIINIDLLQDPELYILFGTIPDRKGRLELLKESLNKNKLNKVCNIIKEDAENNLIDTLTAKKIAEVMPKSFQDPYYKKIQLALYEIAELIALTHPRLKLNLTVPAEAQLPKVLGALGILQYSDELKKTIESVKLTVADSPEERAIRAATILACEKICQTHGITQQYLYQLLWGQRKNFGNIKFHLTKTRRY